MHYSTRHVVNLFGVTPHTVRRWAEDFAKFLSVGAQSGQGKWRSFTEEDMAVFALVAEMRQQNKRTEDIAYALERGERGAIPVASGQDLDQLTPSRQITYLKQQMEILRVELEQTETERDTLLTALRPLEDEILKLKTRIEADSQHDQQLKDLHHEEVRKTQAQIDNLYRDLSQAQREAGESYMRGRMDQMLEDFTRNRRSEN